MVEIQKPPKNIDPILYDYLYQLAEYLSIMPKQEPTAVTVKGQGNAAAGGEEKGLAALGEEYNAIKSLIIKTADTIRVKESIQTLLGSVEALNGKVAEISREYVAISDFGTYLEKLNSEISLDPEAITQYYKFFSELQTNIDELTASFENYKINTEGYIRTGIVDYDELGVPIFGVAVGQNLATVEVDGETVVEQKNFRATYTASKLSFWQDATEVAYVSNNRLYISNITVLNAINIGKWEVSTRKGLAFKWIGG